MVLQHRLLPMRRTLFAAVFLLTAVALQLAATADSHSRASQVIEQAALLTSTSSIARFQGSAFQGVDEETLRSGGSTITIQLLPSDATFITATVSAPEFRAQLADWLLAPRDAADQAFNNTRMTCVLPAIQHAKISVSNGAKLLKITFGAAPQCSVVGVHTIRAQLSSSIVRAVSAETKHMLPDFILGPNVILIPRSKLSLVFVSSDLPVAGNEVALRVTPSGTDGDLPQQFDIVEGPSCHGARAAAVEDVRWSNTTRVLAFRPTLGGTLSICYAPYAEHPSVVVRASTSVVVAGPEGMSTDPAVPRAQVEFSGMIFGTNLTDQDILVITPESSCELVTGDIDTYDVVLSSPARALFWANVPVQGRYQVCYQRLASPRFVKVGTIHLNKGSELIVDKDMPQLLIDQNALVVRNTHISFLTLQQGQLNVDNFQLNVTHFVWTGGQLLGSGSVNCMGTNSKFSGLSETRVIESIVRNFGFLEIDLRHIVFAGRGALHNFGELVLLVNSSGPEDAGTIQSNGRSNVIVNGAQGKITIRFLSPGGALRVLVPIENRGAITVAPNGMLLTSELVVATGASVTLLHYSALVAQLAKIYGSLILADDSEIRFLGDVALRRTTILGSGQVVVLTGSVLLESVSSDSDVEFSFDGSAASEAPVRVSLFGTSVFGRSTKSMLRNVEFAASELTKIIFQGQLICHVPTVTFGSNIVVQSNLAAVMFGEGMSEDSQRARLVPQRIPHNSSFVVPPNATLIIMDTGNLTQSAISLLKSPPRVCDQYVVVPMHVEIDGKVLLWGCAMLPYGATLSGVIYGTNAREIEATIEYAFCRNVLVNPRVCVPLFSIAAEQQSTVNGLSVSGPLTVVASPELRVAPKPSINVDILTMSSGSLYSEEALTLLAHRYFEVNGASTVILTNGGVFATSYLRVDGALQVRGPMPLVVHGSVEVGPTGKVTVDVDTSLCHIPLEVSEVITFHPDSQLRCFSTANRTVASAGLLSFGDIEGRPRLDAATCALNGHEIAVRVTGENGHRLGIKFVDITSNPSGSRKASIVAACVGVAVCASLLTMYLMSLNVSRFLRELRRECSLTLHLSLPEFSSFALNTVVVIGFMLESLFFAMSAFHASLPLPLEASFFIRTSMNFMLPHRSPAAPMFSATFVILVGLWMMLWIPLSGKMSHIVKGLLTDPNSPYQRKLIQFLFQSHTVLSFAFGLCVFPVLTLLLEAVSCGTFLSHVSSCEDIGTLATPALAATAILLVLAPYSAHCGNFPFGHPPYSQALDVRFKRTFSILHVLLVFLQVAAWKIFANDAVALLLISILLVVCMGALVWVSKPCAYTNINIMRLASLGVPLWALLASLVQVIRFGGGSKFVCAEGDPLYMALFWVGTAAVVLFVAVSANRCSKNYDSLSNDPTIDTSLKALMLTYYQIEDLRVDMYNTARTNRREVISNNIARLRIEYLEHLRLFRSAKEKYLLPYYLGDTARSLHTHAGGSNHDFGQREGHGRSSLGNEDNDEMLTLHPNSGFPAFADPVKPQFTGLNGSPLEVPASVNSPPMAPVASPHGVLETDADWILTPDEMDRFHCGPQLGRGSYGTVHMGMLPSGRLVAVKVIQIVRKKKDQLTAVKLEVNMLRSLNHQNIIRYYGCHASQGQMRVFMEFAVGGSLTSLVRKFEKLSEPVMRYYTQQILSGLQFLHSRHVVHRDIKGENILIDGHGVAKLADFGCSKGLADIANKSQNGCGTLVGSPYWMAPEVIKNEAYGTKADIWSVGCTVVEMLNGGHPPWHEKFDNVYTAMYFIANTTEIPSNIPSDVSDTCRDFLSRCFERDVTKRPSALELMSHPWLQDLHEPSSATSSGSNNNNSTPKVERQWSDMFESEGSMKTSSNTSTALHNQGDQSPCVVSSASLMIDQTSKPRPREDAERHTKDTYEGEPTLANAESTFLV